MKRVGTKGEGRFERISWDEALDTIAARFRAAIAASTARRRSCPTRTPGNMGLLGYGSMDRRFFHALGASLLDRTICASAGAAGYKATVGQVDGLRPRGDRPRAPHPRLGREHRQLERPPVAVRRGGAAARRAARHDRPLPLAHRGEVRPAPRAAARDRRRARARHDARHLPRRPRGPRTTSTRHTVGRAELRARAAEWTPERDRGDDGPPASTRSSGSPASTRRCGPRRSASTTGSTATPAAAWPCARSPACPRSSGPGATSAAARCSRRRALFPVDEAALQRPDLVPPGHAHAQHEPARAHPHRPRRSSRR